MRFRLGPIRSLGPFAMFIIFVLNGLCLFVFVSALPADSGNGTNNATTPVPMEMPPDISDRGDGKFGDKCEITQNCGVYWGVCDQVLHTCQCLPEYPISNHYDKCGKIGTVNESCYFNEQCEETSIQMECKDNHCACKFDLTAIIGKDGHIECLAINELPGDTTYVNPAMIAILVVMALMFIIICVVLRLFANARWRENRTIFNTPNPRLMNVSLLRDSKLLHGERRGSRGSVRGPSRQPSMASLRPHSPNSQGSRRGSRGSSNASLASNKSPTSLHPPNTNTPMLESVTVDIQAPKV